MFLTSFLSRSSSFPPPSDLRRVEPVHFFPRPELYRFEKKILLSEEKVFSGFPFVDFRRRGRFSPRLSSGPDQAVSGMYRDRWRCFFLSGDLFFFGEEPGRFTVWPFSLRVPPAANLVAIQSKVSHLYSSPKFFLPITFPGGA